MRDDYAFNLRRDPVLRWRAELYADIGTVLNTVWSVPQGKGVPPKWQRTGSGLRMLQPIEVVEAKLRKLESPSVETWFMKPWDKGPLTQSRLTHVIEAVLGTPATDEVEAGYVEEHTADRMGLREAVANAWNELESADQALVIALSKGATTRNVGCTPR